ncbi:MAG: hypothetical protein ABI723_18830 [Bacteroidia bacterium]
MNIQSLNHSKLKTQIVSEAIKIILLILISSVKFVAGPPFARYFDNTINFSYFETVVYCIIGGMLGVFVFTYFSPLVFKSWEIIKRLILLPFRKKKFFSPPTVDVNEKIEIKYSYVEADNSHEAFSKRYPKLIKVWNKYGLAGVSFLTPILFSIPIGTIVATRLVSDRKKIFLYMFIAIVFWSLVMNSFWRMDTRKNEKPNTYKSVVIL